MVFLIQDHIIPESLAVQLKLNELVASSGDASNRLIAVEYLTKTELEYLNKFYIKLAQKAETEEI